MEKGTSFFFLIFYFPGSLVMIVTERQFLSQQLLEDIEFKCYIPVKTYNS